MAPRAERIEAQRLFPLAGDGDDDRGPLDPIGIPTRGPSVGVKHDMQMRPGIDPVPAVALFRHRRQHLLWLWLIRHSLHSSHEMGLADTAYPLPSAS